MKDTRTVMILIWITLSSFCYWSTGAQLGLIPHGDVYQYEETDINQTFTCYHTDNLLNRTFEWVINGRPINNTTLRFNAQYREIPGESELIISYFHAKWNAATIQCREIESSSLSLSATLILQGNHTAVKSLQITYTYNSSLFLNWSALPAVSGDIIRYKVTIENLTSPSEPPEEILPLINNNYYSLPSKPHRLVSCDDLKFTVTPKFRFGFGKDSNVSQINGDPILIDHTLTLNFMQGYDVLVSLENPLCKVTNVTLTNVNLNESNSTEQFSDFSLQDTTQNNYQYCFMLNLLKRFEYNVVLLIQNSNSNNTIPINISTHSISDIEVQEVGSNQLRFHVVYFDHIRSDSGALLTLLYCNKELCDDIDHECSHYLRVNSGILDLNYKSGYYQLYAYDVGMDGDLLQSMNYKVYPAISNIIDLNYDKGHQSDVPKMDQSYCNYRVDNDTVHSRCNFSDQNSSVKQQLIMFPVKPIQKGTMILTDPELKSDNIIWKIKKPVYYGITISVSNISEFRLPQEIGRGYIPAENNTDYDNESGHCNRNSVRPTSSPNGSDHNNGTPIMESPKDCGVGVIVGVIVGVVIAAVVIVLLCIIIIIIKMFVCKKPKKCKTDNIKTKDSSTLVSDSLPHVEVVDDEHPLYAQDDKCTVDVEGCSAKWSKPQYEGKK